MGIIVGKETKAIVQGITGTQGSFHTKLMLDYGTKVLGGVTPGKGGQEVYGLPVFDTVEEAIEELGPVDASAIFVPAPLVKNAAIEAITAGVKFLTIVPDRVPIYDVLEVVRYAEQYEARFIGPNTLGILSVDKAVMGMIGGRSSSARAWFRRGNIGVTSRSGGMTSSTAYYLCQEGLGLTTIVHVGGDSVVGLPHPEIVKLFEEDEETKEEEVKNGF